MITLQQFREAVYSYGLPEIANRDSVEFPELGCAQVIAIYEAWGEDVWMVLEFAGNQMFRIDVPWHRDYGYEWEYAEFNRVEKVIKTKEFIEYRRV